MRSVTPTAVLLGASNVARCLPAALGETRAALARRHGDSEARILVAAGRGRSYGQPSGLLGRVLPGILSCGLWPVLQHHEPAPTYAFLTDIGNDLCFGVKPGRIVSWVEAIVDRLQDVGAHVALTALALDHLERFPRLFLDGFRRVLFPNSNVPIGILLERVEMLDERLRVLAERRGVTLLEQPPEEFGLDPIHYRLRLRHAIWHRFVEAWPNGGEGSAPQPSAGHVHWRAWPDDFLLWGRRRRVRQPCMFLSDGTPISLY